MNAWSITLTRQVPLIDLRNSYKDITAEFAKTFYNIWDNNYYDLSQYYSANAYIIKTAVNNEHGPSLYGNGISNLGIMISLFPQKFGVLWRYSPDIA